jgi:membrane protein YqaA with SNARE-associated domain
MTLFRELYHWVLGWADSPYSIYALFTLSFAESSFFPIPPDILLMALTLSDPQQGMVLAAVTTAGSVTGGVVGYLIGYIGGRPLLNRWVSHEKIQLIHDYFERYEIWAIGIAGFTPIPYKLFTLSAGAFYINFPKFILVSTLSRGARFFMVAGAIQLFGTSMKRMIEDYFDVFTILFFILLIGGFYLVKVHAQRRLLKHSVSKKPNEE